LDLGKSNLGLLALLTWQDVLQVLGLEAEGLQHVVRLCDVDDLAVVEVHMAIVDTFVVGGSLG